MNFEQSLGGGKKSCGGTPPGLGKNFPKGKTLGAKGSKKGGTLSRALSRSRGNPSESIPIFGPLIQRQFGRGQKNFC